MENKPVVVFLGDSMMMDGIVVSQENREIIKSIRLDPSATNLIECLENVKPDLIVFELGSVGSHSVLSVLSEQPGLPLFALDLDLSRVIVMNTQQRFTNSIKELYQLIQDEINAAPHL